MRTPIIQVNAITANNAVVQPKRSFGICARTQDWDSASITAKSLSIARSIRRSSPACIHLSTIARKTNVTINVITSGGNIYRWLHLICLLKPFYDKFQDGAAFNIFYSELESVNPHFFTLFITKSIAHASITAFAINVRLHEIATYK